MLSAPLGIFFPKNSTLKPMIDNIIRGLKEFGIINHLYISQMPNASECENPTGDILVNDLRPLEMGDFYGVFALYAGGVLLATFTILLELLLAYLAGKGHKMQMRRKQQ
ncbi:uncharacterized protein [Panulirus ornatus]|uniref:uncharacterized protein n=1 Tax=Panulirus ornatus TaxID=150431 RepID=UPI003A8A7DD6